jgi:hypothetical protein
VGLAGCLHVQLTTQTSNHLEKRIEDDRLEKVLYTARVHTTGGRDGGTSRTDDGRLQITLSTPGTSDTGTNPEQLFGAAWSACFLSTIKLIAGKRRFATPNTPPSPPRLTSVWSMMVTTSRLG